MKNTIALEYTCRKCGIKLKAERSLSLDRDELWEDLKRIGREVLAPHFKEHFSDGNGFLVFMPFFAPDAEIDWEIIQRQENEAGTSIIYNLMASINSKGGFYFLD